MKIYIKRNPNELGELAFGENYICHYAEAQNFCDLLGRISGKVVQFYPARLVSLFKTKSKVYLGKYTEDEVFGVLNKFSFYIDGNEHLIKYLEFEDD